MFDTLNIPSLGRLEIVETYAYYDQPVLFSCKDSAGHLYLVVAADENNQYETWLYVRISNERLNLVQSGTIDLHDAFADSEDAHLFQVRFSYDAPTSPQIESIEVNQVSEDMLPLPGECLDLETETRPVSSKPEPMPKNNQDLELILLDKCTIQSLKPEELKIVSQHSILVPSIVLIENLKREETINKISKLKNTYYIAHWNDLAKNNLLGQEITISRADITEIADDPVGLKKLVKLAKKMAKEYDKVPEELLQMNIDLSSKNNMNSTVAKWEEDHSNRKIPDNIIKETKDEMKRKKSIFSISEADWKEMSKFIINDLNNKRIRREDRHLKENERTRKCNERWLHFACRHFQATEEEKTQIFKKWEEEFHHPLKYFAPYAYYILALELTIGLRIIKSKGSYKREIMRDLEYLYYANIPNVTFHTCDRQLKDTIHKIPFLKHIQEKMVYFYNDEEQRPGELNKSDWLKLLQNSD